VTINLDMLVRELRRRDVLAWSAIQRTIHRGVARDDLRRIDDAVRIGIVVHRDLGRGRGIGDVELDGDHGTDDAAAVVDEAFDRAAQVVGPPWPTPAPAAPARVEIEDASLTSGPADDIAMRIRGELARHAATAGAPIATADVAVERQAARVVSRGIADRELAVQWRETAIAVRATLARGARSIDLAVDARRAGDLALASRIRQLVAQLDDLDSAVATPPGRYAVVLHAAAHSHGGFGVWQAIVGEADAARVRQGLARYKPGKPIAPDAATVAEPLTVSSDGTLAWGLRSAPVGDRGEPVRKFVLVDRGIARGVGLDMREAGLARAEPNGGVRDLVVERGRVGADELVRPTTGPVLEVSRLSWLDLDPPTGLVVARIAVGAIHDERGRRAVTGGTLRGDALMALASAQRSRELTTEGLVHGPVAIRIDSGLVVTS
jgi:hypothetical protein